MKKIFLSIFSLIILITLSSCTSYVKSSGSVITKEFSNNEAENLVIDESLNIVSNKKNKSFGVINIVSGDERKVEVKTNTGVFDNLKVSTASNKITLSSKTSNYIKADIFEVTITGYTLNSITSNNMTINGTLSGSECVVKGVNYSVLNLLFKDVSNLSVTLDEDSQLISESNLNLDNLKVNASDYSYLYFSQTSSTFNEILISADEYSKIVLKGKATLLSIGLSEVSTLRGADLLVESLEIQETSASLAYIKVTSSLKYYLTGSSELHYEGSPQINDESYKSDASIIKNSLDK